jgi:hypothetical protein
MSAGENHPWHARNKEMRESCGTPSQKQTRRYHKDPEYRERRKAQSRKYYWKKKNEIRNDNAV